MFYSITLLNLTCSDYTPQPAEYQGKLQLIKKNLSPEIGTVNPYVTGSSPVARAKKFRRKIVDFAAFFFVNTFGFRHTTIHPKTPLFNPLATQQLHRIRNLSAVR